VPSVSVSSGVLILAQWSCLLAIPCQAASLFGSLEVVTNSAVEKVEWRRFLRKYQNEAAVYMLCDGDNNLCSPGLRRWRTLIASLQGASTYVQLDKVNRAINALVKYRSDDWVPSIKDRWASPLESISNGGDCEDYAILKYVTLRELGFSEAHLRLVIVKDRERGNDHAVLAVILKHSTIILDNRTDTILPQEQVTAYIPLYSISGTKRWFLLAYRRTRASRVATTAHLQ